MKKANAKEGDKQKSVLAQIAALNTMEFKDLKAQYVQLVGREPPSKTRKQVIARLAYRIQEIAYGGLSQESRARLEAIYEAHCTPGKPAKPIKKEQQIAPTAGTKLVREHLGKTYEVIVRENGFEYEGCLYRSLSAIAKKITGSHTSGPAFFGLSKKGGGK